MFAIYSNTHFIPNQKKIYAHGIKSGQVFAFWGFRDDIAD
jgi:hypothetical protein